MSESHENLARGEVLQEFEFEGRPAQIVRLEGSDADTFAGDLEQLARGLAVNQETRTPITIMDGIRARFNRFDPSFGRRVQHATDSRVNKMKSAIKEGNGPKLFGVVIDERLASVLGIKKREIMSDGRQIYEFTGAATLPDKDESGQPQYARKGLYNILKKVMFEKLMTDDPNAVFLSDSRNPHMIAKWASSGWIVADIDDPREFAQIFRQRVGEDTLNQVYRPDGYRLGFLDPKTQRV